LLVLTLFLAWLGIYSEGLQNPAVVIGNLAGGFLMLGLVGWLTVRPRVRDTASLRGLRVVAGAAIAALCLQILFGGLTSANFAATACPTVPACNDSWFPGPGIADAFDLRTPHRVNDAGQVVSGGAERIEIHKLHRISAVIVLLLILAVALAAIRARASRILTGVILVGLVFLEFAVGIAAVVAELPISLAVAHNWLAALLLLALLKLFADIQAAPARGFRPSKSVGELDPDQCAGDGGPAVSGP
jgi:cytochrome c oxidase assembly protein subunit 15